MQQQREHEDNMRARLKRSESIEMAAVRPHDDSAVQCAFTKAPFSPCHMSSDCKKSELVFMI